MRSPPEDATWALRGEPRAARPAASLNGPRWLLERGSRVPVCSNCGGSDFVWADTLKTGTIGRGALSLRAGGELALGTRVCRGCGHADLFVKDPTILRQPHTWRPGEFVPIPPRPGTAPRPNSPPAPAPLPASPSQPVAPPAPRAAPVASPAAPAVAPMAPPPPPVRPPVDPPPLMPGASPPAAPSRGAETTGVAAAETSSAPAGAKRPPRRRPAKPKGEAPSSGDP